MSCFDCAKAGSPVENAKRGWGGLAFDHDLTLDDTSRAAGGEFFANGDSPASLPGHFMVSRRREATP